MNRDNRDRSKPLVEPAWKPPLTGTEDGPDAINLLIKIRSTQLAHEEQLEGMDQRIADAIENHATMAFPGADPESHRRAHEIMMEQLEEKRKLRKAIQEKTLSGLVWAFMIWLGLAILTRLKIELGLPP